MLKKARRTKKTSSIICEYLSTRPENVKRETFARIDFEKEKVEIEKRNLALMEMEMRQGYVDELFLHW